MTKTMQTFMGGQIIPYEFEDPLSYTVQHCNMVAASEGAVVQAQRNCVRFEKTAHLQDELGDRIQINSPGIGAEHQDVCVEIDPDFCFAGRIRRREIYRFNHRMENIKG